MWVYISFGYPDVNAHSECKSNKNSWYCRWCNFRRLIVTSSDIPTSGGISSSHCAAMTSTEKKCIEHWLELRVLALERAFWWEEMKLEINYHQKHTSKSTKHIAVYMQKIPLNHASFLSWIWPQTYFLLLNHVIEQTNFCHLPL